MAFHRALDGAPGGVMPWEWWVSRLCEEFGCVPSVAMAEIRRVPAGLLEDIVELRAYARAKQAYDAAETAEARDRLVQTSALADLVEDIEFTIQTEALARRKARAANVDSCGDGGGDGGT